MDVVVACVSLLKREEVWRRGGSRFTLRGGRRMTGSALQALGVELTCESFVKGEGSGERVVVRFLWPGPGGFSLLLVLNGEILR